MKEGSYPKTNITFTALPINPEKYLYCVFYYQYLYKILVNKSFKTIMKERISLLTILTLLFTYCSSVAQDVSNYSATGRGGVATTFATDYQTVGINPANLGFRKSVFNKK